MDEEVINIFQLLITEGRDAFTDCHVRGKGNGIYR